MPRMKTSFWISVLISLLLASCFYDAPISADAAAASSVDYAPGDTRLLSYSPFCQSLTVTYPASSSHEVHIGPSLLYALSTEPTLTSQGGSFDFNRSDILLDNSRMYYKWDLHFYRGSEIRVSACMNVSGSAVYYLIKGKDGFNDWKVHSQMTSILSMSTIDNNCLSSRYFEITEEDQYFLVIQRNESVTQAVSVNISISFNRTEYAFNNEAQNLIELSSFNVSESGSVQTPLNRGNYILLVYGNSSESPENWNTIASQLSTDTSCEPRIWLYAVVSAGGVLVLLLCIACLACCMCAVCRCKRQKSSELNPLLRDWDDVDTAIQSYHPYVDRGSQLDNLTELAIAAPDASNPHIAHFKEDLKSPSFQDNYLSSGSPRFSTFKP